MARISVIIPTYNRANLIGEAVDSILAQDLRGSGLTPDEIEILVADDGSTDDTAAVIARYGDRVRFLALPHRGHPGKVRNSALRVAQGDTIAFLDSDDLYLPNKFALQYPALMADPTLSMVYSDGRFFVDDVAQPTGTIQAGLPTPSGDIVADLMRGNFLAPPVVLMRRHWLEVVGYMTEDPGMRGVEDYNLWLRLAIQAPVCFVPGEVAAMRRHLGNMSGDVVKLRGNSLAVLEQLDADYPEVMRAHRVARHEAYARHHGAVALAAWQQHDLMQTLRHTAAALRHTLQLPGAGTRQIAEWSRRRRMRAGIDRPTARHG